MPATTNYNIKFLKCKCILENYSVLDSPPSPLTTPRHESGTNSTEIPGDMWMYNNIEFCFSLTKMRTIIIIRVFSLGT